MLRFITKHRFSFFDGGYLSAAAVHLSRSEWTATFAIIAVGSLLSVLLEKAAKR